MKSYLIRRTIYLGLVLFVASLIWRSNLTTPPVFSEDLPEQTEVKAMQPAGSTQKATFGGGCFWCTEAIFQELNGVKTVTSGYSGGSPESATYKAVCSGKTQHAEVIQITFDPNIISYADILEVFWKTHDPTTLNQQGADIGPQYRSVIFYHDEEQKEIAEAYKKQLNESGDFSGPLVTEITPFKTFFSAELYHQNYFATNSDQPYCQAVIAPKIQKFRKTFSDKLKKEEEPQIMKSDEEWKKQLTPEQFYVTREQGTERAFTGAFWDHKEKGVYKCVCCGEPLFDSHSKFDSGCGWPSYSQPLQKNNIVYKEDKSLFMTRTEVKCKKCDAHLGHVFNDGPTPTGLRYCINSASLDFEKKAE